MKVGGAIYSQCEYFFTCADLRGPRAWILCTTPLYLFVPSRIGTVNSLTPKSVPAGTKNSRSEGFLLVKHKHTNIPTMMEPFAPPAAWDLWILPIVRADPLPKGSGGGVVEGI